MVKQLPSPSTDVTSTIYFQIFAFFSHTCNQEVHSFISEWDTDHFDKLFVVFSWFLQANAKTSHIFSNSSLAYLPLIQWYFLGHRQ